ncbi:MAG: indole-3-glycerol phosphate synthase TrpC [Desulfobacterota bacterium]|nr:indole-3-glycerol phosphate synthase TrpC [Thermodesulfobacteriota bacterium]MDW8002709.1 indole-3-glycerol phosphate synthase TrpC [Deltaproteobacteria bacterium]
MFLKKILEEKRPILEKKKRLFPEKEMENRLSQLEKRPFLEVFSSRFPAEIKIIAEFKRASPTAGTLNENTIFEEQIKAYEKGGADSLSIVTEEKYFKGDPSLLRLAKKLTHLPVLRKDFLVDPYEIVESKYYGADCVLLIAEALTNADLKNFLKICGSYEVDVLLEVHTKDALTEVLNLFEGNFLLGINSRNLSSLSVDLDNALNLLKRVPSSIPVIMESGIKKREDIERFVEYGVSGFLVGTLLMRSNDPEGEIRRLKYGES